MLSGRHFWFVGIGGAGMSALALVAHARGATVGGSDRAAGAYVARLEDAGIRVAIGHAAENVPRGAEVIVSSAIDADNPEIAGRDTTQRGAFLSELVNGGRSIVVAGAHGKTTTTAMIAFALTQLEDDPTFLVGGDVPQLSGNGRAGTGWLVAEGDESDRSLELLRPDIALITNVELDHHATFASSAEVEALFAGWLSGLPEATSIIDGRVLDPLDAPLSVPGEHNRLNAACATAGLVAAGYERHRVIDALAGFRGVKRRLEYHGDAGGIHLYDDYAHHPTEVLAALSALREARDSGGRLVVLFQPHLYTRTLYLGHEFAQALAAADVVCVTGIYAAREEAQPGVSGKLIVDALTAERPGMEVLYASDVDDAAALVAAVARPGDTVVTLGAGNVDAAVDILKGRFAQ
ncbi:MAG: UDP-N-acetylmuramate--L-alanine ligase [Gaiellaceae bacterium]